MKKNRVKVYLRAHFTLQNHVCSQWDINAIQRDIKHKSDKTSLCFPFNLTGIAKKTRVWRKPWQLGRNMYVLKGPIQCPSLIIEAVEKVTIPPGYNVK